MFRLADGRFREVVRIPGKKPKYIEGKTKAICKKKVDAFRSRMRLGGTPVDLSVAEVLDLYVERCRQKGRAARTISEYIKDAEHLKKSIGALRVWELNASDVEEAIGTKPKSAVNRRALLRAAIRRIAQKMDPNIPNAAMLAEPPSYTPKGTRALTLEELGKVLEDPDDLSRAMWLVLADTGLRPDEASGLKWSEVVREKDGWWIELDESKTDEGKKPIPLTDTAQAAIKKIASHTVYVFANPKTGEPYREWFWRSRYRKAGPAGTSLYAIRHTFGSQMAKKVRDDVLKRLMRHTDVRTTKRYYIDVEREELRAAVGRVGLHTKDRETS